MTDADWAGDVKDRRSYSGIAVWVKGSAENTWYPVYASSKKQNVVSNPMWFDGELTGKHNSCREMRRSPQKADWKSNSKHVDDTRLWRLKLGSKETPTPDTEATGDDEISMKHGCSMTYGHPGKLLAQALQQWDHRYRRKPGGTDARQT